MPPYGTIRRDKPYRLMLEKLVSELLPYIIPIIIGGIIWLWKMVISMREKVSLMEQTMMSCKTDMQDDFGTLKEKINSERDQIHKMIDKMQQRQDSHSKKQDDLVNLITELKVEMLKQIGDMTSELSAIGTEVKNINRSFEVFDDGIKRRKKKA